MKTIFLILLFIVPGLIYSRIKQSLNVIAKKSERGTIYEQSFFIVANSAIISILSFVSLRTIKVIKFFPTDFDALFDKMNNLHFLGQFLIVSIVVAIVYYIVCEFIILPFIFWVENKYQSSRYKVTDASKYKRSAWDNIMIDKDKNKIKTNCNIKLN